MWRKILGEDFWSFRGDRNSFLMVKKDPCPPNISTHPWSINFWYLWANGRKENSTLCDDRGDKNHIEHEALCDIGEVASAGEVKKENIIDSSAPITVTINGAILYWRGRNISWLIGVNSQLIILPLKIAPMVKSSVGMEMFRSVLEMLWIGEEFG